MNLVTRFVYLLVCWTLFASPGLAQVMVPGDLNDDAFVDSQDMLIVQKNWHAGRDIITIDIPGLPDGARPLRLVRIPAGSFLMGNAGIPRDQFCACNACDCEKPPHQVIIAYDYYLGETEVTQAQWQALMGSNPSSGNGVGSDYPVYNVSWDDITQANGFLAQLNALNQGTFRLPSEAEWEYSCRGSASNLNRYAPFSFGDDPALDLASCTSSYLLNKYIVWCGNINIGCEPVRSRLPNDYGLYDMHGNVWEWCQDCWHENYNGAPTDGSAWTLPSSGTRVIRGGNWFDLARDCRSAVRTRDTPDIHDNGIGVRVALPVSP